MNKRNFFKGLVALLAMPGNIYAKVFTKPKPPEVPCMFNSVERTFVRELQFCSFDQIQVGMLFTTTASWGNGDIIFEVVSLVSGHAFVTPRNFPSNPDWPMGMARILYFEQAKFSDFTFYAPT